MYAYMDQAEILNTAYLTGTTQDHFLTVMNVWNVGSDTQVTDMVDCGSSAFLRRKPSIQLVVALLILPGSSDGYKNIQVSPAGTTQLWFL